MIEGCFDGTNILNFDNNELINTLVLHQKTRPVKRDLGEEARSWI